MAEATVRNIKKVQKDNDEEWEDIQESCTNLLPRTARMMQQMFAESSGLQKSIFWDLFTSDEKDFLNKKIEALYPNNESELAGQEELYRRFDNKSITKKQLDAKLIKLHDNIETCNKKIEKQRTMLLETLWLQRKYSNGNLISSTIYVIHTPNITENSVSLSRAQYSTDFTIHTLFRIRKCFVQEESENCCMVFIDETGRVYQNWNDYIENNVLPEGVLVVPSNGIYDFTDNNEVILEFIRTPNCNPVHQILERTDTVISIGGFGAAAIPLTAIFLPVSVPLLIGAGVVGGISGLWSLGRSAANLIDRGQHEQSINVTDRQARANWIGIAGGAAGLGASGATQGLARYATSGKDISRVITATVNGFNIFSIAINGVGVGNGIYELFLKRRDNEKITTLDLLQLSASLILFTHSVYNIHYAAQIVETANDGTINSFRTELSNRQRKIFNKMYKETIRVKGPQQGKIDIVRSLSKIPDNKQFFNDISKVNSALNAQNVRQSFSGENTVLLNNNVAVDAAALRQSLQHGIGENPLNNIPSIPRSYSGNIGNQIIIAPIPVNRQMALRVANYVGSTIGRFYVENESNFASCLSNLIEKLSEDTLDYLIQIVQEFMLDSVNEMERALNRLLPFEIVLWDLFNLAIRLCKLEHINREFLRQNMERLLHDLKIFYVNSVRQLVGDAIKCKVCRGTYRISTIA